MITETMHQHNRHSEKITPREKRLVVLGNPNVGKSVIFGHLTGKYVTVSNYPGTTVDISYGFGQFGPAKEHFTVSDSPGINSLIPHSEDERVARDLLLDDEPDLVVQVADEKNLRRALHLTLELAELEIPLVLCLNMSDEAKERGIRTDVGYLEKILGVPVVETVAITGQGMEKLKHRLPEARIPSSRPKYSPEIERLVGEMEKEYLQGLKGSRGIGLALLAGDKSLYPWLEEKLGEDRFKKLVEFVEIHEKNFVRSPGFLIFEYNEREALEIVSQTQQLVGQITPALSEKVGYLLMRPFPGYLVLLGVLFLMYEFVGVLAAGVAVNFLEEKIFHALINPFLAGVVKIIPFNFLQELLVGEYGIFTMALTYSFAIILPIVTAFFLFFGLLEDSGYLPRLSVMLDRVFRILGLNGKAVLPMVLGLGCDTMATLSTRILETKKERLIATLLLALAVPCSAQLGVILAMLSGISWQATVIWLLTITFFLTSIGYLASRILPGVSTPFLLEIPPLRRPSVSNIFLKVKMRLVWYLKEAVPLFILGTLFLFISHKIGLLTWFEHLLSPIVVGWTALPVKTTGAFIVGFLRRDYGAAGLYALAREGLLNPRQIVVSLVVVTLFVPCIAQFLVTIREQGLKRAVLIFLFCIFIAFFAGGILNFVLSWVRIL